MKPPRPQSHCSIYNLVSPDKAFHLPAEGAVFTTHEFCSLRSVEFALTLSQIYKSLGGSELNKIVVPHSKSFAPILASLESQALQLDELGAHVAAAYLDAAILRLKLEDGLPRRTADA